MLFNSIEFALFFSIVFVIYWFIGNKNIAVQNFFLLLSSCFFYAWWDVRFLCLILFSSLLDYYIGRGLSKTKHPKKQKLLLLLSLGINLGLLGFFKYCNFFIASFAAGFSLLGKKINVHTLEIILPIGISFYTFKTISYTIDVHRKKIQPCNNPIAYLAYVTFFPQLLAGPIEKAKDFLGQFEERRFFNYDIAVDGLRQILCGLFKKIVIADNCAAFANPIFNNSSNLSGSELFLGAFFFTFQIYGDFAGYSDISIGIAKLLGFKVKKNFAYPYFSRNMAEFWRRWHISLMDWFRDYLYIPLGGNRCGMRKQIRNVFLVFCISGFWHGANWTFIAWGLLNAVYFLPLLLRKTNRANINTVAPGRLFPSAKEAMQISITFLLACIAWIFFRAENIQHAFFYLKTMLSNTLFSLPPPRYFNAFIVILLIFIAAEWIQREKEHFLQIGGIGHAALRWSVYYIAIILILIYPGYSQSFIYFQF